MTDGLNEMSAQSHYRALRQALKDEGYEIVDAWHGRHLRVQVQRNGKLATLTMPSSPQDKHDAVKKVMWQAKKATRPN